MVEINSEAEAGKAPGQNLHGSPAGATTLDAKNPFPGPKPYFQDQRELFFGRDEEIDELTSLVLSTSAVLLYAPSGSGKSSLLQAGLVPSLEDFGCRILPAVRFGRVGLKPLAGEPDAPPQNPFVKLVCDTVLPEDVLPQDRLDLGELAARLRGQDGGTFTLLILDQFEELFTNQALWRERGVFLTQLRHALDANPWLHVILAIRSDYLANLLPHERDMPGRMLIRYGLESLRERAAREAVKMAFAQTAVPLTDTELDLALDRLLNLDVGVPGVRVRGQYVNLIQLQILCRRLWREKAAAGSADDAAAADDSQLLQESSVNLVDYMQSYVDDAVASVVAKTRCDAGIVRRWLEDRLTTPGGRRALLLVDNAQTAGLPEEVLQSLENARLIQVEQRNQSQWAELTHDSMVAAVQASNRAWGRTRRRARLLRTAALGGALLVLLGLFPLLLAPTNQAFLLRTRGYLTGTTQAIAFPAVSQGDVAVVAVTVNGFPGSGSAIWIAAESRGSRQYKNLTGKSVTDTQDGQVNTTVTFAIDTVQSTTYEVMLKAPHWKSNRQTLTYYNVNVQAAPVVMNLRKPGPDVNLSVHSPVVAVRLYPDQPEYLSLGGLNLENVLGVQTLLTDSVEDYVLESPAGGYAVLSSDGDDYGGALAGLDGQFLGPGPSLSVGEHADIKADTASMESVNVKQGDTPFGVETSCETGYGSLSALIDSGVASVGDNVQSVPEGSVLVASGHGDTYDMILLADPAGNGIDCRVTVRSFAQQAVTTLRNRTIGIPANTPFNSYPVRLPSDAVILVPNLNGTPASLDCPANHVTESDSQRLLAFVPANQDCELSLAHPSGHTSKPVSFRLLIDPVTGGTG
jgi:hypothetical protein